jgi:hypothetical protein
MPHAGICAGGRLKGRSLPRPLQLPGEFDGSAACELIKQIEEESSGASKIMVGTSELQCIHPFGVTVFKNKIGPSGRKLYSLTFLGKYKHLFEY